MERWNNGMMGTHVGAQRSNIPIFQHSSDIRQLKGGAEAQGPEIKERNEHGSEENSIRDQRPRSHP